MSRLILCLLALITLAPWTARADEGEEESSTLHFQATFINQSHGGFASPYSGPGSLLAERENRYSLTSTLYVGLRPWKGGEVFWVPEMSMGEGFSGVRGIAAFPNGEVAAAGGLSPTFFNTRFFLRQTFDLGGGTEWQPGGFIRLAGSQPTHRLTVAAGLFSAMDFFDDNRYNNDPRTQFMNWAIWANGAWDYPGDGNGYTEGVVVEYARPAWSLRGGVFKMPSGPNKLDMERLGPGGRGFALELENRYSLWGRSGRSRLMLFANEGRMGSFRAALDQGTVPPDLEATRRERRRYGWGINFEQEVADGVGAFLRLGWNDGQAEVFTFTEIDRTLSAGVTVKGLAWGRPEDEVGLGFAVNGLSRAHREYLAAGGSGVILGDGALGYGREAVAEAYYSWSMAEGLSLTLDWQRVRNPGYNADRGPVDVVSSRVHYEF